MVHALYAGTSLKTSCLAPESSRKKLQLHGSGMVRIFEDAIRVVCHDSCYDTCAVAGDMGNLPEDKGYDDIEVRGIIMLSHQLLEVCPILNSLKDVV